MQLLHKKTILYALFSFIAINAHAQVDQFSDSTGAVDLHMTSPSAYTFDTVDVNNLDISQSGSQLIASQPGVYKIHYQLNWSTTDTSRRQIKTYVLKNGTDIVSGSYAYGYARRVDQAGSATNSSTFYMELSANDYIELIHLKASTVTGQALSIAGESSISLHRVGNILAKPSCMEILQDDPGSTSGIYTIDPDGAGPIVEFSAYCDMAFDGGGWTLVSIKENGQAESFSSSITDLTDYGKSLDDNIYLSIRSLSTEMLGFVESTIWGIADLNYLTSSANCSTLPNSLIHTSALAHEETIGCDTTGLDYCKFSGALNPPASRQTTLSALCSQANSFWSSYDLPPVGYSVDEPYMWIYLR